MIHKIYTFTHRDQKLFRQGEDAEEAAAAEEEAERRSDFATGNYNMRVQSTPLNLSQAQDSL